ncbi:ABC transporter permease subunit [Aquihabitans sp. McL0605]|uniref:ABC transporter permease subunit n=1 Tax=Aquihabitans sp. McL0605 TaxID=3415671 RepID=UPI003CFB7D63
MSAPDTFSGADAQILDRGYRKYDGPRTGVTGAVQAVVLHSIQRALGMRRSVWAKILPTITIAFAYVPAIVFVGIVALFPKNRATDFLLPGYGDYYGYVISAIMIFVALVAPEVLCTDRRTGMLGVYLASPLDRDSYLFAKATSIAAVLSLVCLGPPLLMFVANVLQSTGPDGVGDIIATGWRVLLSGAVITSLFTGITMGLTSLTDRKAVASATIILLFLVSISMTATIHAAGAPRGVYTLAPTLLGLELAQRIHGDYSPIMRGVPDITIWIAWAGWTVGGFALARNRLHHLPVTR